MLSGVWGGVDVIKKLIGIALPGFMIVPWVLLPGS